METVSMLCSLLEPKKGTLLARTEKYFEVDWFTRQTEFFTHSCKASLPPPCFNLSFIDFLPSISNNKLEILREKEFNLARN
jgi:hypothetical protein